MTNEKFESFQSVPQPGQLVEVRKRLWIVSEVTKGNTLYGQHLVAMASIDSIEDEIQIIWEIEPGARTLEKTGLPSITGWDDHNELQAFLDAVRWTAITNADRTLLQSPFRSGITIEDYQLDPLVRSLEMARVNLLIADDVGLGKTIEAGLVVQELILRNRARTVLVICPASLQIKWKLEMVDKFGLEFRIVDTEYLRTLRRERGIHVNPWTSYPRLITSMDWIKSGEGLEKIQEILSSEISYPRKFDILIIDEAHNIAPSGLLKYAIETQRTNIVRKISPHFNHKLFLTATPHNGYQESFTSLLELLDDQRFARSVMPNEKQLHRVLIRRLKSEIKDSNGNPVFPERKIECLNICYSQKELQMHVLLNKYIQSRTEIIKDSSSQIGMEFTHILLKKRFFSSPLAFFITLQKHKNSILNPVKIKGQNDIQKSILKKAVQKIREDFSSDIEYEAVQSEAIELASKYSVDLTYEQKTMLDELMNWAEKVRNSADSKADAIFKWIEEHLMTNGNWNNKRVVIFTEYRATHTWLQQLLSVRNYGGKRVMSLHGGMAIEERERVKAAFQASPDISPVRILLATDAASEGIDLQNYCNYLIHIEIPWNPNVMEQRNGRIDRHGQKQKEVYIWHPVGQGFVPETQNLDLNKHMDGDHEYLMRAALKINTIREDLGSAGPIIAQNIEDAMMGRTIRTFPHANERMSKAKKILTSEKRLAERIKKLHDKLIETKEALDISSENMERLVQFGLKLAEKPPLILLDTKKYGKGRVFQAPFLQGSWGKALVGLEHPHTGERRPITFDQELAKGRDDIVLIHLNHRLVQLCLRILKEELWKHEDRKKINRVSIYSVSDKHATEPIVLIWSRLIITGGDTKKLHEELTLSGGELKKTGFTRINNIGTIDELLKNAKPKIPSEKTFGELKLMFNKNEDAIISCYEARSRERLRVLENTMEIKRENEKKDILQVLSDLELLIRGELSNTKDSVEQLVIEGFGPSEREQLTKDYESLERRLERIPHEKEKEVEIIENHYRNPIDRTFPVAVLFIIPESITL